jgi:hypothetical protein
VIGVEALFLGVEEVDLAQHVVFVHFALGQLSGFSNSGEVKHLSSCHSLQLQVKHVLIALELSGKSIVIEVGTSCRAVCVGVAGSVDVEVDGLFLQVSGGAEVEGICVLEGDDVASSEVDVEAVGEGV